MFKLLGIRATPLHAHISACFATSLRIYINKTRVVLATVFIDHNPGVEGHIPTSCTLLYHTWACGGIESLHNSEDFGKHDFACLTISRRFFGICHYPCVLSLRTIYLYTSYHMLCCEHLI